MRLWRPVIASGQVPNQATALPCSSGSKKDFRVFSAFVLVRERS
jgi:hypothetical protein